MNLDFQIGFSVPKREIGQCFGDENSNGTGRVVRGLYCAQCPQRLSDGEPPAPTDSTEYCTGSTKLGECPGANREFR